MCRIFGLQLIKCRRLRRFIFCSSSVFFFQWDWPIVLLTQLSHPSFIEAPIQRTKVTIIWNVFCVYITKTIASYRIYVHTFERNERIVATNIFAFKLRFKFNFDYVWLKHTCFVLQTEIRQHISSIPCRYTCAQ